MDLFVLKFEHAKWCKMKRLRCRREYLIVFASLLVVFPRTYFCWLVRGTVMVPADAMCRSPFHREMVTFRWAYCTVAHPTTTLQLRDPNTSNVETIPVGNTNEFLKHFILINGKSWRLTALSGPMTLLASCSWGYLCSVNSVQGHSSLLLKIANSFHLNSPTAILIS